VAVGLEQMGASSILLKLVNFMITSSSAHTPGRPGEGVQAWGKRLHQKGSGRKERIDSCHAVAG
jgi:hypothetical protein